MLHKICNPIGASNEAFGSKVFKTITAEHTNLQTFQQRTRSSQLDTFTIKKESRFPASEQTLPTPRSCIY